MPADVLERHHALRCHPALQGFIPVARKAQRSQWDRDADCCVLSFTVLERGALVQAPLQLISQLASRLGASFIVFGRAIVVSLSLQCHAGSNPARATKRNTRAKGSPGEFGEVSRRLWGRCPTERPTDVSVRRGAGRRALIPRCERLPHLGLGFRPPDDVVEVTLTAGATGGRGPVGVFHARAW
jgi:hypothetical protein